MLSLSFNMFNKYKKHTLVFHELYVLSIDNYLISKDILNAFSQVSDYIIMVEWFCWQGLACSIAIQ